MAQYIIGNQCLRFQVEIDTVEKFEELRRQEQQYFTDMVQKCKDSGAGLVVCQWGFDDEANHLLMHHHLPAVRWVGGVEVSRLIYLFLACVAHAF